jgi:hypothetical protein
MTERSLTQQSKTRGGLRRAVVAAVTAALAVTALPLAASPAAAAEASSAVTVDIPTSWIPTEGGTLTVSKTTGLADGETITISGTIPVRATSGAGLYGGFLQTASSYAPEVTTKLTDAPVARGTKTALTPVPNGWSVASTVEATVTVHSSFTTGPDNGDSAASPGGIAVDCKVEQCFLALTSGVWSSTGRPDSGSNLVEAPAIWVPITFEGGNAELVRDVLPAVTGQPADATVAPGETAVFRTTVAGQPAPTYRWQTSANDGSTWTDIAGATAAELSVTATETDDGRLYRAVATNRQGTTTTRSAAVSVQSAPVEPGEDDGKWALGQPGSWVTVSAFSGLTDGQQITIEAEYLGRAASETWPADWAMPVSQGGFGWPNDRWEEGQWDSTAHKEAKAEWVQATAIGDDRYRGSATYTVHNTLPDPISGKTYDCRITQCYLYIGGNGFTSDGRQLSNLAPDPSVVDGVYSSQLSYLSWGGSGSTDHNNSILVPLYFDGGSLPVQERTAPSFTTQPASQTVEENNAAELTVATTGLPTASVTWQRSTDGGQTWRTIGGATGTTYAPFATASLNNVQYRAVATNALGTAYSDPATLTVNPAGDTAGSGVTLEWIGNAELQSLAPNRQANYFSAGVSEGSKASYENVDGDAKIVWRKADGSEALETYDTRAAHTQQGGQQVVRLSNGTADLDAAGSGTISWNGSWTVNFYGGLVPFTFTNPRLTIADDGTGTLVADLGGYGSSMDDPGTKVPLEEEKDVVVSTFSSVTLRDGVLTILPDYAGVEFDIPVEDGAHAQDRTVAGWGAWPQSFVDFHFKTGLTSYWYTSGGTADGLKPGLPFTVSGITLPAATAPAAPAAPTITAASGTELDVSWAAPATGGSPITGYTVTATHGDQVTTAEVDGSTLSTRLAGLALGTEYAMTVTAKNAIGSSEPSAATTARTHGAPGVPAQPTLAAGDGASVVATWTAPESDGGSAITGYLVTLRSGDEVVATRSATEPTATFEGLARGAAYTVDVAAQNALGTSAASAASASVTIGAIAPDAPAAPVVVPGVGSLEVAWTAPAANGSAILDYTVTATPTAGGAPVTATVPALSASLPSLDRGTAYDVTVTARNEAGSSAASAATSATTLAEAPSGLAAPTVTAVSGTELHVAWVAPADDGGVEIVGYRVDVFDGDTVVQTVQAAGDASSATVAGLDRGTGYTVTVTADNGTGTTTSEASDVVRTLDVPAAPVVTAERSGATGVTASWTAPADGGSPVTEYVVTFRDGDAVVETRVVPAGTETVTVDGLAPGAQVTASVVARNAVGDSAAGASEVVAIPAVAPDAVATPSIAGSGDTSVLVRWVAPAFDGGSPVTGYTVSLIGTDGVTTLEVAADATTASFEGLAAGSYSASVVAVNAVGASEVSEASPAVKIAGPKPDGSPTLATDDLFTEDSAGGISVTVSNGVATITVPGHEGEWVGVSFHSDPVWLGWNRVAEGAVSVELPAGATGVHHLVVYAADGSVIGYAAVDLGSGAGTGSGTGTGAASGTGLATTGGQLDLGAVTLAALLLLGGAGAFAVRRRQVSRR